MTDREQLEREVKSAVSSELFWDLLENIDDMTDAQLRSVIEEADVRR